MATLRINRFIDSLPESFQVWLICLNSNVPLPMSEMAILGQLRRYTPLMSPKRYTHVLAAKSDQNNRPDRVEDGNNEWDWTEDSTERESPRKSLRHLQNGKHEQDHSPEQYRKGHNSTRLVWGRLRREFTLVLLGCQNTAQIPEHCDGYQVENFCDAQAQQLKMLLPGKIERECRSIHAAPDLP
jgi:hypothetical protein